MGPSFYLQAFGATGTATYTATAPGYAPRTGTVFLTPSGIVLTDAAQNLPFATVAHGGSTLIRVMTAQLNAGDNSYSALQALRGGLTLNVGLSTTATNIATVVSPVTLNGGVDPAANPVTTTIHGVNTGITNLTVIQPSGFVPASDSPLSIPPSFNPTSTIRLTVN